jgi:vacuolar-type H+-ATPase subunit H
MNRVWGRRARGGGAGSEQALPDPATSHDLVRELERSIEARLTAAEAGDEVTDARAEADRLIAEAEVRADEAARDHAAAILSEARVEAKRLAEAGTRRATDLAETAALHREEDVSAVMSSVLPAESSSSEEEAS